MCGIMYVNDKNQENKQLLQESFNKIKHRGPDASQLIFRNPGEALGFHRLQINGHTPQANQPMTIDGGDTYLLCNGEIYNHVALQKKYNITCTSGSDCEVILYLYKKIGFAQMVQELDGEFAIILVTPDIVYIARDPYGVRALYMATGAHSIGLASENKALYELFHPLNIMQFLPGHICEWSIKDGAYNMYSYYKFYRQFMDVNLLNEPAACVARVRDLLIKSVQKRLMCARLGSADNKKMPAIGAYLSGGFDSSAIAAILQKELAGQGQLETFSIGFEGSPDLYYAKKVALHIGSKHHEYIISEEQALQAIPEVVRMIETYDITTVRASTMMYLLSEYISKQSKVVVMLSGEGSDEASGSYRYFHNAPNAQEFHLETERLLKDLCYFDNLRADKSSAAWGLEIRVPFLDLDFLKYYMTIPPEMKTQNGIEKYLLRTAVSDYLPHDVLYRPKEAMSDGVSVHNRSWSKIIQYYASKIYNMANGLEAEKFHYLSIFKYHYNNCLYQMPYYWLPKWCGNVADPSARVLPIYNASV
jgi:asparagine synthase (glutamine-hydrolysing)